MQNPRQSSQDPHPDIDDGPVDLAALRADDALIDALAAGHRQPPANPDGSDDLLVTVLAAWATGVAPDRLPPERPPMPIDSASEPPRPRTAPARHPYLMRLAAAAVLVVMALSSMAVQAGGAEPGDTLWGMSKVFYADRARSVEAVDEVEILFEQVYAALREGRPEDAAEQLETVRALLPVIRDDEGRDILVQQEQQLSDETANAPARVGPPGGAQGPTESPAAVRADAGPTATEPAPPAAAAPAVEPAPVTAAAASTTETASTGGTGSTDTALEESTSPPDTTEPASTTTNTPAPTTDPQATETSGEANTSSPDSTDPPQPRSDPTDTTGGGEPEDDSPETGDGTG
ncbi:MAG: anti-sigma-D factor RsdA [Pseudonocardia sp.]